MGLLLPLKKFSLNKNPAFGDVGQIIWGKGGDDVDGVIVDDGNKAWSSGGFVGDALFSLLLDDRVHSFVIFYNVEY